MSQRTLDFANWMLGMNNVHYHNLDAMARAFDIIEAKEKIELTKYHKLKVKEMSNKLNK